MTDFGRRLGVGDMLKAMYDPNEDGVIALDQTEADMTKSVYDSNDDGVIAVAQTEANMKKSVYDSNDDGVVDKIPDHLVDRGVAANPDWTEATLTADGQWHELNCSSIVPAGAKWILFTCGIQDDTANMDLILKKNGRAASHTQGVIRTNVAGMLSYTQMIIACDTDRKVTYNITQATIDYIALTVRGWVL